MKDTSWAQPRHRRSGEVVFTTGMAGYQEILTDPTYFGQIVVADLPAGGQLRREQRGRSASTASHARGCVVREWCAQPVQLPQRGHESTSSLKRKIDQRASIDHRHPRHDPESCGTRACMRGLITRRNPAGHEQELMEQIKSSESAGFRMRSTTTKRSTTTSWDAKYSITHAQLRHPQRRRQGADGARLPHHHRSGLPALHSRCWTPILTPSSCCGGAGLEAFEQNPAWNGNGSGTDEIGQCRSWASDLGHQVMALAHGRPVEKLHCGHRGANQPGHRDLHAAEPIITSQNHGYEVVEEIRSCSDRQPSEHQ